MPQLHLSDSSELLLRLRWLAILSGRRARRRSRVSGGVHEPIDAVKAVMAGADARADGVGAAARTGPTHLAPDRQRDSSAWADEHEYESLAQMRGSMSLARCPDPAAFERGNYVRILQSWHREPSASGLFSQETRHDPAQTDPRRH